MTWEGEPKSFSANMLNGVARFLYAYKNYASDSTFKEKLGAVSIKELTKIARERRAGSLGYAEAMLIVYNKRLKNGLEWTILYSSSLDSKKHTPRVKLPEVVEESDSDEQIETEASTASA